MVLSYKRDYSESGQENLSLYAECFFKLMWNTVNMGILLKSDENGEDVMSVCPVIVGENKPSHTCIFVEAAGLC